MHVRKLRVLRLKYHISLTELSQTSGLSSQRISQLELSTGHVTDGTVHKLLDGLEQAHKMPPAQAGRTGTASRRGCPSRTSLAG